MRALLSAWQKQKNSNIPWILRAARVYSTETPEIDSVTEPKHFESDESKASESNTNEGESSGSLNNIVEGLKTALTEFKHQFDTYRFETNKTIQT